LSPTCAHEPVGASAAFITRDPDSGKTEADMNERMTVVVGSASAELGAEVCNAIGREPAQAGCRHFPDGEMQAHVDESVRGRDVFLLQATSPPVERHLMELLLLADACRRAGAGRLTAVIPYFGYARQDRRSERRSLGGRVAADVIGTAGFDRLMLIDAHTPAIEGFFAVPLDHLTAVPLLARAAGMGIRRDSVVVAPDLGAVKLARAYAKLLRLPMAFVHKTRLDGEEVEAHAIIGEVRGRHALVVDDMLSTGATIEAAVGVLRGAGALEPMSVAVTHALLVGDAPRILRGLPIERLIAGNTVALSAPAGVPIEVTTVAPLIATAIQRVHSDESLADLRVSA
jgi:ribose-phosphate pyrophosphokinase